MLAEWIVVTLVTAAEPPPADWTGILIGALSTVAAACIGLSSVVIRARIQARQEGEKEVLTAQQATADRDARLQASLTLTQQQLRDVTIEGEARFRADLMQRYEDQQKRFDLMQGRIDQEIETRRQAAEKHEAALATERALREQAQETHTRELEAAIAAHRETTRQLGIVRQGQIETQKMLTGLTVWIQKIDTVARRRAPDVWAAILIEVAQDTAPPIVGIIASYPPAGQLAPAPAPVAPHPGPAPDEGAP